MAVSGGTSFIVATLLITNPDKEETVTVRLSLLMAAELISETASIRAVLVNSVPTGVKADVCILKSMGSIGLLTEIGPKFHVKVWPVETVPVIAGSKATPFCTADPSTYSAPAGIVSTINTLSVMDPPREVKLGAKRNVTSRPAGMKFAKSPGSVVFSMRAVERDNINLAPQLSRLWVVLAVPDSYSHSR